MYELRSSFVVLPFSPVPGTDLRSILSSLASLLTPGDARKPSFPPSYSIGLSGMATCFSGTVVSGTVVSGTVVSEAVVSEAVVSPEEVSSILNSG